MHVLQLPFEHELFLPATMALDRQRAQNHCSLADDEYQIIFQLNQPATRVAAANIVAPRACRLTGAF
jgi:hypothetical protein